jgi:hypothetical protein
MASVEGLQLDNHGLPHFMRCISSPARGMPIKGGTYAPVVSVHGHAPKRNAIIVDCWGDSRQICECEDGHWQLAGVDGDFAAEFVPA